MLSIFQVFKGFCYAAATGNQSLFVYFWTITEDRQIPSQTSAANVQKRVYQLQLSCSSRVEHQFVRDIYIYMYNYIYIVIII